MSNITIKCKLCKYSFTDDGTLEMMQDIIEKHLKAEHFLYYAKLIALQKQRITAAKEEIEFIDDIYELD